MKWRHLPAILACVLALGAGPAGAATPYPLAQGLHQWPAAGGKLMLVVGTYQDSTTYRRTYSFYFKDGKDDAWNQVPVPVRGGRPQTTWDSAVSGDATLADGIVVQQRDGVYFVVADKRAGASVHDAADVTVTWYRLTLADDAHPDDPPYSFQGAYTRNYPKTAQKVEAILAREAALAPRQ